jgi:DNA-binding HxlR family transcriptional regulator
MSALDWIKENSENFSPETTEGLLALAEQMQQSDNAIDSPIREVFALLGDKWTKLILLVLWTGTFRHAALKRTLEAFAQEQDGISQRILTLKLRSLERDGLITRYSTDDVPPRVDYSLTEVGKELTQRVNNLIQWISKQSNYIENSRGQFEQKNKD